MHIKEEADFLIREYSSLDYEEFAANRFLKLSAQKSLEIIGEAAAQVSDGLKEKYSAVPW
ncbi:MAG TPA: hypothetical protein O0X42_00990 [Methanocorpusculum sp.]|nr:hypothetical protein [Methanocorpusculum sp.]